MPAMASPAAIAATPMALATHWPRARSFSSAITIATTIITVRFITPSTSWMSISAQQQAAQKAPWWIPRRSAPKRPPWR